MNKYKQEMINDRELIYDAKKQLHKADEKYKSGINMAGTSMGSYDKPMMKGSGLMQCGCQIGKHMGGPKMMSKKSCGK